MRSFGCEAGIRPMSEFGWVCHGEHLTVLLTATGIPCVLPDVMVPDALAERQGGAYDEPAPFAGGDHVVAVTLTFVTGALLPAERTVRIEQPADVVPVPTPSCPPGIDGC
jgi:hypothetical protein